jgi:hypothetical protein
MPSIERTLKSVLMKGMAPLKATCICFLFSVHIDLKNLQSEKSLRVQTILLSTVVYGQNSVRIGSHSLARTHGASDSNWIPARSSMVSILSLRTRTKLGICLICFSRAFKICYRFPGDVVGIGLGYGFEKAWTI